MVIRDCWGGGHRELTDAALRLFKGQESHWGESMPTPTVHSVTQRTGRGGGGGGRLTHSAFLIWSLRFRIWSSSSPGPSRRRASVLINDTADTGCFLPQAQWHLHLIRPVNHNRTNNHLNRASDKLDYLPVSVGYWCQSCCLLTTDVYLSERKHWRH